MKDIVSNLVGEWVCIERSDYSMYRGNESRSILSGVLRGIGIPPPAQHAMDTVPFILIIQEVDGKLWVVTWSYGATVSAQPGLARVCTTCGAPIGVTCGTIQLIHGGR